MAEIRKAVMSLMRTAIKAGQSRTAFLRDMKLADTTYLRRQMVADWTTLKDYHDKTGALTRVRKDAFPAVKSIVTTDWDIDGTFMYVIKVKTRIAPDEPITERFVDIVTDEPMTPRMMEQAIVEKWVKWEYEEIIEEIVPWTAIRTTI